MSFPMYIEVTGPMTAQAKVSMNPIAQIVHPVITAWRGCTIRLRFTWIRISMWTRIPENTTGASVVFSWDGGDDK